MTTARRRGREAARQQDVDGDGERRAAHETERERDVARTKDVSVT
jgi:hypothetical protein